jgi:hypothetical protein
MNESKAQVAAADVLATVLVAAGSDKAADFGENIFDIPEDENRSRRYLFQLVQGTLYEGNYINAEYEILGPGRDLDSWHLREQDDLHKNIYD